MSPFEECGSGSNADAGLGAGCVPTERHSESDAGRHQTEPEEQATHVPIVKTSPKSSQGIDILSDSIERYHSS